ncbi:MAG: methionine ABC transporter ATP-binding protein [Tissierellia bacterium]|nr:methionine ABC transporter ATP-binding protein [Tissierellia bacterium]
MIELQDISVVFTRDGNTLRAVDEVNLTVEKGDIFGIVGFSGAGKSTLVRTINLLQPPTEGTVTVSGTELTSLSQAELRQRRKKIGMIFQHFNLMNARTILENVTYPLKRSGLSKEQKRERAMKLLKLVGIEEKAHQYPKELSGGQKQRVAIARALANEPEILLCDEATSALDPQTTLSILHLLKELNRTMDLTIVLITHEMQAVKEICNKVAVMEAGRVVEQGTILDIFANPKEDITKEFINTANHQNETRNKILEHNVLDMFPKGTLLHNLKYIGDSSLRPLLADLYQLFAVKTNILAGSIEYLDQTPFGNLLVVFEGEVPHREAAIAYLRENGVAVTEEKTQLPQEREVKHV